METLRKLLRWLHPPAFAALLLAAASGAGLVWVFLNGMEEHPAAYAIYLLSFYSLCAAAAAVPGAVRKGKALVCGNAHARRYFSDAPFRARLKLYSGTVINLAYGIFKLTIGILYRSVWFGSVACYYMVLALLRLLLVSSDRRSTKLEGQREKLRQQWRSYRACGWLLLLLNAAIAGMAIQMIWQNKGYSYPGFVIYASAAYTFYRLTMAVVRAVKNRRTPSPIFSAAGVMDLCAALMAVFALQSAMFASFGGELPPDTRLLMNILTGGAVSAAVVCLAVFMIVRGTVSLNQTNQQEVSNHG